MLIIRINNPVDLKAQAVIEGLSNLAINAEFI